jgi:hypothetical protein
MYKFSTFDVQDVGFSVEYYGEEGTKFPILPYQRYELNQVCLKKSLIFVSSFIHVFADFYLC